MLDDAYNPNQNKITTLQWQVKPARDKGIKAIKIALDQIYNNNNNNNNNNNIFIHYRI